MSELSDSLESVNKIGTPVLYSAPDGIRIFASYERLCERRV